jgi:D-serine dehydratase
MTRREAAGELAATLVDQRTKGIPLGERLRVGDIGQRGWNVARGDLPLPVTTLSQGALTSNLDVMKRYCERHGVFLAPHGKTTMSPQLFHRQLDAGAWAITAATPTQAAVMRDFGIPRVLLANEVVEPDALRWIAREMDADHSFEVLTLVDDVTAVRQADQAVHAAAPRRALPVLLEIGVQGGRAGVRTAEQAMSVARAVAAAQHLTLAGVETFEDVVTSDPALQDLSQIDQMLGNVRDLVHQIAAQGLFGTDEVIVTAGGSAYFDRVIAHLNEWSDIDVAVRLVLRSGCYLTHDLGRYHRVSPFDGRRAGQEDLQLTNALLGWARVLSRPEPGLAIIGSGKRDLPYDLELPIPLTAYHAGDSAVTDLRSAASVRKIMDQHAFMSIRPAERLRPGDIIALGMSHPCTAFDKTKLIPVIDDRNTVIDAVLTFF